jgi:hypothetical protein
MIVHFLGSTLTASNRFAVPTTFTSKVSAEFHRSVSQVVEQLNENIIRLKGDELVL